MQYRKQDFTHNFTVAVKVDSAEAWEILLGAINELSLDEYERPLTLNVLQALKIPFDAKISDRDLSLLVFENIYTNDQARDPLLNKILNYFNNPYNGASVDAKYGNVNPADQQATSQALTSLLTDKEPEFTKAQLAEKLTADLQNKQSMRNLPVPFTDRLRNIGFLNVTIITAVLAGTIYLTVRLFQDKPLLPKFK